MRSCQPTRDRRAGRATPRARWMAVLLLAGLMLALWGGSQQAAAWPGKEEGVERPLLHGERESGPLLYFEGGSGVQTSPKVYVIFWGSHFETEETAQKVHAMLLKLFEGMSGSAYEGILTQYFNSTGGSSGRVGSTVTTTSWIDSSVTAPSVLNEQKAEEEVEHAISVNKWNAELNAQFVLVTAPGSTYEPGAFEGCAYHGTTNSGAIYDFVPYQGDEPLAGECLSLGNPSKNPVYKTSKSASHEFAETATDPHGNTWGEDDREIADLCVSDEDEELPDGAWAQRQYDDHQSKCSFEDPNPAHVYTVGQAANGVTSTNATLNGIVNPEAYETHYYFELGTTESYGTRTTEISAGSGTANVSAKQVVCGLAASTTYYFRLAAVNSTGTTYGERAGFNTAGSGSSGCPSATTDAASGVGVTEATLNGAVDPNGLETKFYFEYGTSVTYGKKTSEVNAGSGTSSTKESQAITGLTAGTEYHFRLIATSSTGTTYGVDKTFKAAMIGAPTAITEPATDVTATEAIIHGSVDPDTFATTVQFEYGLTSSYGTTVPATAESAGSGIAYIAEGYTVVGLKSNTTYHFRMVAKNSDGTSDGQDATFTTAALTPTFSSTFGSSGEGDGQFDEPAGVAVYPVNGMVLVCDQLNDRVEEFNGSGEYVRQFGGEGTGNGQFREPRGVAVDAAGNIWVTDTGNNRVEEFTEAGTYVSQFGTTGTGNGQLKSPKGLAIDSKGDVWVTDSGNNRVEEFNEKEKYVRQFSAGTNPIGIAVDSNGNVWSDNENTTGAMEEHNGKGELLQRFATRGFENGEVWEPKRLVAVNGYIWVADAGNNRVEVFGEAGEYVTQFGTHGGGSEQMDYPTGVAIDAGGNVWITDDNERVDHWKIESQWPPTFASTFGSNGGGEGQFEEPAGIAVNPINGVVVVADEGNDRLDEFNEQGEYMRDFGNQGTGNGQLDEPRGVAVDGEGDVWVTDTGNNRVEKFGERGEYLSQFGTSGTGNGQFKSPKGVAIDSKGDVWVTDSGNNRVEEFNKKGEYLRQFGTGTDPIGIAVDSNGNVWSDNENTTGAIEEHNKKGELLQKFAARGFEDGEVWEPKRMVVANGYIWVADAGNDRVEVFSEAGAYVSQFGTKGSGAEQMNYPVGVAVDPRGNVWVTDDNERVDHWLR